MKREDPIPSRAAKTGTTLCAEAGLKLALRLYLHMAP